MLTETPSSVVGRLPFTIALSQVLVEFDRLAPWNATQDPAAIPGFSLAAFTTPLTETGTLSARVPVAARPDAKIESNPLWPCANPETAPANTRTAANLARSEKRRGGEE